MNAAPIILFTFKRAEALKESIGSLLKCPMAEASDLIVFSDAPRNEQDNEKVFAVRQFLHSITGFKSVKIIERTKNLGVDYNLIDAFKEISKTFDKFIVIEDDLIYSENFLVYLNQGLDFYRDDPKVLNLSAFSFINKIPSDFRHDAYFTHRSWTWGWGSWGYKMKNIDWEVAEYPEFIKNKSLQNDFNNTGGSDLTKMLRETMEGKMRTWDVRMFYYQFRQRLLTLYPVTSKVVNIGFHNEGSHTFGYNRYKTKLDETNKQHFSFPDSKIDERLNSAFLKKNNLLNRITTRVLSMIGVK